MTTKPTVAIIGVNGKIGKPVLKALTGEFASFYQLPIRVLTRSISSNDKEDYDPRVAYYSSNDLDNALGGVDVLINTASSRADHKHIVDRAVAAGVKLYFPSDFDMDFQKTPFKNAFKGKLEALAYARSKGQWKSVHVKCGLFGEYMLTHSFNFGLDVSNGVWTERGDGNTPVTVTFLEDVGRAVASVAHQPVEQLPEDLYIQGDSISRVDYVRLYGQLTGQSFNTVRVPADEALVTADGINNQETISREEKFKVIQAVYCLPEEAYHFTAHNHNELVNPNESLFKWTKFVPSAKETWVPGFKQDDQL